MMRILLVFMPIILMLLSPCQGQQVSSRVDSIHFLIGDQTRLVIEGVFPSNTVDISFLKTTIDSTEAIEFVNQSSVFKETTNGSTKYWREFRIAFFDTGAYYIPTIPVVTTIAGRLDTFYTAAIPIQVRPIQADSIQMMAIKPIILEEWKLTDFWPYAAAILGLAVAFFLIFRSNRKRSALQQHIIEVPKTPYEIALIALSHLEDQDYVNQGKLKEHFSQLSIIIRTYIEQEYKFPALESTTREIGYGLDAVKFDTTLKSDVLDYLQKIDFIKFAKVEPTEEDIFSSLVFAKNQIERMQEASRRSAQLLGANKNDQVQ